jgi:Zn-dependent peptidase ImmA (M78 family)/transcriptional regulator with XRE-family HTH domain
MRDDRSRKGVEAIGVGSRFNPDMLAVGRDLRKMTQATLAKRAGVTQALMSKVENGLVQPSAEVADKIASALKLPVAFFYQRADAHGLPAYHYFRRKKLPAKTLASITAEVNLRSNHLRKLLRSEAPEPARPVPQYDLDAMRATPEDIARMARGYWMLPRGPIKDLTALIEDAGCVIVACNFGTCGILDAISMRMDAMPPLIFIDRTMPADRFNFTLAHELGHLILHTIPDNDDVMEDQADEFASSFLMPREDILPYLANVSLPQLAKIKPYWRVAIAALLKRATDLDVLSSYEARDLWMQYSKYGYRRGEPAAFENSEPRILKDIIKFHMHDLQYSVRDMANLLLLEPEEFEGMYLPRREPKLRLVT